MFVAGDISESRTINYNSYSVANSTLVPSSTPVMYGSSTSTPNVTRSLNEGQPATSSNQPPVGWLDTIGQRFQTTDISEETREILLAAWRQNTTNAYASAWNKWVGWCGEQEINPISVSWNTIFNVYCLALSAVLPEIDSSIVAAHPLLSQLLKGIFHLRPPEPKYSHT
jgi:hypothetical protein